MVKSAANIGRIWDSAKEKQQKMRSKAQKASKSACNAKKKADLVETVSTLVRQSEEEEAEVGVAAFLCQFFLHSGKNHAD